MIRCSCIWDVSGATSQEWVVVVPDPDCAAGPHPGDAGVAGPDTLEETPPVP